MELILGYAAGLLTLINPCVLPVLPIVLASALQASRFGPLTLAAGLSLGFVAVGLGVAALGQAAGLGPDAVARGGALVMAAFGLVLLLPVANRGFSYGAAGLAARADCGIGQAALSGAERR